MGPGQYLCETVAKAGLFPRLSRLAASIVWVRQGEMLSFFPRFFFWWTVWQWDNCTYTYLRQGEMLSFFVPTKQGWIQMDALGDYLPLIIPTCPKKLFAQGPRQKYFDIVTDTIHASSSWKSMVMIKLNWTASSQDSGLRLPLSHSKHGN